MNNLAVMTCINNDRFLYFSRVITFDFATNGIRMPFLVK
jgi:hypothetical protein